jgi:hypothetical protein
MTRVGFWLLILMKAPMRMTLKAFLPRAESLKSQRIASGLGHVVVRMFGYFSNRLFAQLWLANLVSAF